MHRIALLCLFVSAAAFAQEPQWKYGHGPFQAGAVFAAQPDGSIYSVLDYAHPLLDDYLMVSWNNGRTWQRRSQEPINDIEEIVVLSPQSMLAVTYDDVLRSDNNGLTWRSVGFGGTGKENIAIGPNGTWYVSRALSLYKSPDEGETWTLLPSDDFPLRGPLQDVIVAEDNSVLVTWFLYGGLTCVAARRSVDGGYTWEDVVGIDCVNDTTSMVQGGSGELFIPSYDSSLDYPDIPEDGLFRSLDNGATWEEIDDRASSGVGWRASGELLIGVPGGIRWNGPELPVSAVESFVETPNGVLFANTSHYYRYRIDPPESVGANESGSYRLDVGATEWQQAGNQAAAINALDMQSNGALFVGTNSILATEQDGAWAATGFNISALDLLGLDDNRMLIATGGGVYEFESGARVFSGNASALAVTENITLLASANWGNQTDLRDTGIYRSDDDGDTWSIVLWNAGNVDAIHVSEGGVVLAATYGGADAGVGVYRSVDDGLTWPPFISGLSNTEVHSVFSSGGLEYAGTEDGVFVSSGGNPWSVDGLPGETVHVFVEATDGILAGTSLGLFRRVAPNTWDQYGIGLEDRAVLSLLVTEFEGEELIVAGTDAGVYLSRPGLITVGQEQPTRPISSSSFQAPYPNPAHDEFTIRFDLAQSSSVRIQAFDTLGREVARIVDGQLSEGSHIATWRIVGWASGAYLIRFEAGEVRSTQRVIVLR